VDNSLGQSFQFHEVLELGQNHVVEIRKRVVICVWGASDLLLARACAVVSEEASTTIAKGTKLSLQWGHFNGVELCEGSTNTVEHLQFVHSAISNGFVRRYTLDESKNKGRGGEPRQVAREASAISERQGGASSAEASVVDVVHQPTLGICLVLAIAVADLDADPSLRLHPHSVIRSTVAPEELADGL